jgi:hypothetical protein
VSDRVRHHAASSAVECRDRSRCAAQRGVSALVNHTTLSRNTFSRQFCSSGEARRGAELPALTSAPAKEYGSRRAACEFRERALLRPCLVGPDAANAPAGITAPPRSIAVISGT